MFRLTPEAALGIGYIITVGTGACWLLALGGWVTEGGPRRLVRRIKKRLARSTNADKPIGKYFK